MSTLPQISDAEWNVMSVAWENEKCTANEIVTALSKTTTWSPKTIKTMISRLVKKRRSRMKLIARTKKHIIIFQKYQKMNVLEMQVNHL